MDKVYDKCCGIDVHKKLIVACFRKGNKQEVRDFGATTRELLELAEWLKEGGCEMAAMESTASYWKPLYNILESSDLNAMVVNARHMKAVPGRKTDVKDAEWIAISFSMAFYKQAIFLRRISESSVNLCVIARAS